MWRVGLAVDLSAIDWTNVKTELVKGRTCEYNSGKTSIENRKERKEQLEREKAKGDKKGKGGKWKEEKSIRE